MECFVAAGLRSSGILFLAFGKCMNHYPELFDGIVGQNRKVFQNGAERMEAAVFFRNDFRIVSANQIFHAHVHNFCDFYGNVGRRNHLPRAQIAVQSRLRNPGGNRKLLHFHVLIVKLIPQIFPECLRHGFIILIFYCFAISSSRAFTDVLMSLMIFSEIAV